MIASPAKATRQTRFKIEACCAGCADVAGPLRAIPGVSNVCAWAGAVVVEHAPELDNQSLIAAARKAGIRLASGSSGQDASRAWWRQPKIIALAAASALLIVGLALDKGAGLELAALIAYVLTAFIGGIYPARSAIRALRRRRLTISSLLVVAAAGAMVLGVFEEAALLIVVFSLGEVLEEYVADRARGSIRALMEIVPPTARTRSPEGAVREVPVEELAVGDVVEVRPGERLPCDGEVVRGESAVDQSPVTGESIPVEVADGSHVFSGTVNGLGALDVRVTHPYADTVIARIIHQVQEAQAHKGQAQRFADRFGAIYTPTVFVLAILIAVLPLIRGGDMREWAYRALVVLTVSCSCGLVISVPAAVVAAITRGARSGILIKGGVYLEKLAGVTAVGLDKTGTLTRGRPSVTRVVPAEGTGEEELLRMAAAVEAISTHPLAEAILGSARARGLSWPAASGVRAIPGTGMTATVDGRAVAVGRPQKTPSGGDGIVRELQDAGNSVVEVLRDGALLGHIAVADTVRPDARAAVEALHPLGVRRVVMLTGDNERTARAVAASVGIDEVRAEVLPEQKSDAVHRLRQELGTVVMVGDGINDAPALAAADVGVAMGAAATAVAMETADVALMADDLARLPESIALAQRAMRVVRQNIVLSLVTVASLVVLAVAGVLSLTTGLLLNEGTALLIILNGLRLLRAYPRPAAGAASPARDGIALPAAASLPS